jgi:hypothetical protein
MKLSIQSKMSHLLRPSGFYDLLKKVISSETKDLKEKSPKSPKNFTGMISASKDASFMLTIPTSIYKIPNRPTDFGCRFSQLLKKTYG